MRDDAGADSEFGCVVEAATLDGGACEPPRPVGRTGKDAAGTLLAGRDAPEPTEPVVSPR